MGFNGRCMEKFEVKLVGSAVVAEATLCLLTYSIPLLPPSVGTRSARATTHSILNPTMATIMTPSRFGSSLSGAPPTYPISMADTLPTVDFGFADLRERMQQFTVRFDDFIERGRKRVLEERNAFRLNVAELEGTPSFTARCMR